MSGLGVVTLLVLLVLGGGIGVVLAVWRPSPRWANRKGLRCPGCGGGRTRTLSGRGDRLDGMLECRACARAWRPEDHTAGR